jgi:bifunctional DNA-binding transcriptional regulator/antitoxin component of YhaV-PrlF toxin-antitoxin module
MKTYCVTKKGRITIPHIIRKKYDIEKGTKAYYFSKGKYLEIVILKKNTKIKFLYNL